MSKINKKEQRDAVTIAASKGHQSKNKGGAIKNDALKPRMSLVPQLAKLEVAKVMTYGAEKYAAYNWMEGFDWTLLSDAIERHATAFNCGEDIDPESGLPHLAHIACSAMMLLENTFLHPELDDRWIGWKTEKGKQALEKVKEPYKPSEYLKNVIKKQNSSGEE